jgi:hypothetical protein
VRRDIDSDNDMDLITDVPHRGQGALCLAVKMASPASASPGLGIPSSHKPSCEIEDFGHVACSLYWCLVCRMVAGAYLPGLGQDGLPPAGAPTGWTRALPVAVPRQAGMVYYVWPGHRLTAMATSIRRHLARKIPSAATTRPHAATGMGVRVGAAG